MKKALSHMQIQYLIIALVLIGSFAAGWIVLVAPQYKSIARTHHEISQVESKAKVLKTLRKKQDALEFFEKRVLAENERHQILNQLGGFASQAGLDMDSLTPQETKNAEDSFFSPIGFRLQGQGHYNELITFLKSLESGQIPFWTKLLRMQLQRSPVPGQGATVSVEMNLETVVKKSGAKGALS